MELPRLAVRIALLWLSVATAIGVLLRAWPLAGMPAHWHYRFFLHAHSHVLLLGWVFNLLYAGLLATCWRGEAARPVHRRIFWRLQLANLGMLLFFPVQGYAAGSIAFSTLHLALSGWLAVRFWRGHPVQTEATSWITWAFVFMVLSALGPFALGYFKANGLEAHPGYALSIYFYLHFQYNGWFVFACIGLALALAESRGIAVPRSTSRQALRAMVVSCLAGFALSALWTRPGAWVYGLGFGAALLQAAALWPLARMAKVIVGTSSVPRGLWTLAAGAYLLKTALQLASAFPAIADWAYQDRNVVIAYLHLVLIGVVSFFLMGWVREAGLVRYGRIGRRALLAFVLLFAGHEVWLGAGAVAARLWTVALPGGPWPIFVLAVGMWVALAILTGKMIFTGRSTF